MNTYYTIDEKYLRAVDKLSYGKTSRALQLLNEIVSNEPLYAKAHFQLGKIYFYDVQDCQAAGYHFKTCMELDASFPDNYHHYLRLVVFLNMEKLAEKVAAKALTVPGVHKADIYELLGLLDENNERFEQALAAYQQAFKAVTSKTHRLNLEAGISRVELKIQRCRIYLYSVAE
ncbi:MAG TPA: hypothetical protein VHA56_03880 [Mucilaginibacter sp.]|nr:hypothetical protein [Mucilaginibacter sp.]